MPTRDPRRGSLERRGHSLLRDQREIARTAPATVDAPATARPQHPRLTVVEGTATGSARDASAHAGAVQEEPVATPTTGHRPSPADALTRPAPPLPECEETLLRRAFDDAALGMVVATREATIVKVNPSFAALIGQFPSDLIGHSLFDLMHNETVGFLSVAFERLWDGELERVAEEHRWRDLDGADLWLAVNMTCVRGEGGEPRYLLGQFQDVTDRLRIERALRKADQRFRAAIDHGPTGMVVLELDGPTAGRWIHVNPAFATMLGRVDQEIYDISADQLIHPEDLHVSARALAQLTEAGAGRVEYETRLLHAAGDPVWVLVSAALLPADRGRREVVCQVIDISDRVRHEHELRRLATHDPLTGLPNRRAFQQALDLELARVQRYGGTGSLLVLDLDGFKAVNDTLGHAAGDQLLRDLAALFGAALRTTDMIARIGGDEFALVLPQTDVPGATLVADRLLAAAAAHGAHIEQAHGLAVSASIGMASFDREEAATSEQLIHRADLAMYEAKQSGNGRACASTGSPSGRRP